VRSNGAFGLFDDDLRKERQAAEFILEKLLSSQAVHPSPNLKHKILALLNFEPEALDLDELPVTDRHSDHLSWLKVIEDLLPKEPVDTIFMQEIRRDENIIQTFVVTRVDVPEETHEAYEESFFILEGHCRCTIGNQVFELSAGDYLDIPLHLPHDVHLLSEQVTAILQYRLA
jgi:mannose-6-phosphate isomerase-like protein (cupin superfamily)